jgi:hypothetical protein
MSNPKRIINRWNAEETEQLLSEIQQKLSVKAIAEIHTRSTASIMNRLNELAADYHFFDELPNEQIATLTGLTLKQIVNAVERRKAKIMISEKRAEQAVSPIVEAPVQNTMSITPELNPVEKPLQKPLEKFVPILTLTALEEEPTLADVYKLLKDIQKKVEVLERVRVRLETSI